MLSRVLNVIISQIDTLSPKPSFVIFGGGGGTIDPAVRTAWNVHDADKTYCFSVIDIDGSLVTVNTYGGYKGAYSVIDTFTINK